MKLLVTAGPTREPLDPVRFLSNRSTGKMGYAVAAAALRRGHEVCLVSGPVALTPPAGAACIQVMTALEMLAAVEERVAWCDALVMSAAVADWRPASVSTTKLKKARMAATLALLPNPDILATIAARKAQRVFVGFAAETQDPAAAAQEKLRRKGLDMIVANDVSRSDAGFAVDTNQVTCLTVEGERFDWPLLSKVEVAERILEWIETRRTQIMPPSR